MNTWTMALLSNTNELWHYYPIQMNYGTMIQYKWNIPKLIYVIWLNYYAIQPCIIPKSVYTLIQHTWNMTCTEIKCPWTVPK